LHAAKPVVEPVAEPVVQLVAEPAPVIIPMAEPAPVHDVNAPGTATGSKSAESVTLPVRTAIPAGASSASFIAAQAAVKSVQFEKLPDAGSVGLKETHAELPVVQGGTLSISANPSTQELLDRAKYWESHGRNDLADKLRNKIKSVTPTEPVSGASRAAINDNSGPANLSAPVVLQHTAKPSSQALAERSKYWEVRGRTDLAEKLNIEAAKAEPKQPVAVNPISASVNVTSMTSQTVDSLALAAVTSHEASKPPTESRTVIAVVPVQGGMSVSASDQASATSKQALADKAQYWIEHGRPDLAEKAQQPARAGKVESLAGKSKAMADSPAQSEPETLGRDHASPASGQALADKAQYWADHGRTDLADQLRKKLQQMAPESAGAARDTGRSVPDAKRTALEDYLLKNPDSLKARLDLALIYRSIGEIAKAREQIDSVLMVSPDLPDALFASAQLYADQRLWWETLHVLEKISPASRTPEMGRLQKIGWAHVQIDRADALVRQGDNQGAEVLLRQVAAELVVNYNQTLAPEPPPLWKSEVRAKQKPKRNRR
jgi:tetratricopeptide (TPR) repeat protein